MTILQECGVFFFSELLRKNAQKMYSNNHTPFSASATSCRNFADDYDNTICERQPGANHTPTIHTRNTHNQDKHEQAPEPPSLTHRPFTPPHSPNHPRLALGSRARREGSVQRVARVPLPPHIASLRIAEDRHVIVPLYATLSAL